MAPTTAGQATVMWTGGECEKFTLFAIKNVSTGDTVDLSGFFRVIMQVAWLGATVSGVAQGAFTGTTLTVPAGLTNAAAYALVQGVQI